MGREKRSYTELIEQNMLTIACFLQGNPPFSQRISLGSLWLNKKGTQNSHFRNFRACLVLQHVLCMQTTIQLAPGLEISRVVTGLWQIADMERNSAPLDPVETANFMAPYVKAGFTSFDMADHYGSSEIIAGTFKNTHPAGRRSSPTLYKMGSQAGSDQPGRGPTECAIGLGADATAFHRPDAVPRLVLSRTPVGWTPLWYLTELKEEGLIQQLGLTNFDAAHLRIACASGIPIVSNQVCHSLIDPRAYGNMAQVCEQYGVKLLAFGTLAGGFLSDKWLGKPEPSQAELETWSQMKYKRFIDAAGGWDVFQQLLETVKEIADAHGVSIANISSRYILENPQVAAVIVGARLGKSEHIADTLKLWDIHFSAGELERMQAAQQALRPIPGDCGDEYRTPPFLTASGDLSHHLEQVPKAFVPTPNRRTSDTGLQRNPLGRTRWILSSGQGGEPDSCVWYHGHPW